MLSLATTRLTSTAVRRCSRYGFDSMGRTAIRNFSRSALVANDDLPYHIVVGMPALSPTMETGTLSEWYVEEGSGFSAGESIAKIETDKASIDFEAQDDGFIAKILMEPGTEDIEVGVPIMVTVEEEEDVAAFADFVVDEPAAAPAAAEPEPEPVVEAVAPPPAPVVAAAPPAPVVEAAPTAVAVEEPPEMEAMAAAIAPVMSTGWGDFAKINSPILKTLSKQQQEYVAKYGTTGQVPF
eukprot:CAMPEP_0116138436 /NCGR_PEP_ID=MMETSP0329-20121206/12783_1 /TAXON_ID=697910 /ORGANISM="Pseudo-nitzschia arenysensis, Strain B593" /LENGTH=238 /DNA_ID=CAMNT_0003633423 /DNA_START=19 /DNA_END=735 /DNA_ORIENTATION=+